MEHIDGNPMKLVAENDLDLEYVSTLVEDDYGKAVDSQSYAPVFRQFNC
jgi:hypothetical protein